MNRFSKLVAVIAALPILAVSSPALAASPGQLDTATDNLVVKNLTQGGASSTQISTACNEELRYSVRLHNQAFGGLSNIQVSVNLQSGKMTAVPAEGTQYGTTGQVTVTLPNTGSLNVIGSTTVLLDSNGSLIKNLPDGITTIGVNAGGLNGSTTEFVQFKAKVVCPPVTPESKLVCTDLGVTKIDNNRYDFTAHGSAVNTTITSYNFTVKNSSAAVIDTNTVNTSATSAVYHFNQSTPGTYTVSSVVNAGSTSATSASCSKQITVETTPAVQSKTTELPNTGPGAMLGLFAGASTLGAAAHYSLRRFRR